MYLAYFTNDTKAKNKLEEEFSKYLRDIDRTLIADEFFKDFMKEILNKYNELCEKHNRCKPIEKRFLNSCQNNDFILYGSNCNFKLLKSK